MPTKIETPTRSVANRATKAPLLEEGMRLDAIEFHRRYSQLPNLHKAELIEGVVHMPSPTHFKHVIGHASLSGWVINYATDTPDVIAGANGSLRLDMDNEVQPDALMLIYPGGPAAILADPEDDIIRSSPELAIEISVSSRVRDRIKKYRVYEATGIQEYLIWQVKEKVVEWFRLVDGKYLAFEPDSNGIIRSVVFPGLWLDTHALVVGNQAQVRTILNQGMASKEYKEFVRRLKRKNPEK